MKALVLIGSQARNQGAIGSADAHSDWDFQIVTSRSALFGDRNWIAKTGLPEPLAYAVRLGRLARVGKATAVFRQGTMDLVLLPASQLRIARWLLRLGLLSGIERALDPLRELSLVLGGGHRLLKGGKGWATFFQRIAAEIPPARLSDGNILAMAEAFVCDYVSTWDKISRGEFIAAQRWLHAQLAETNFRFFYELRLRHGLPTFHDARRIELLGDVKWGPAVMISAAPNAQSLGAAIEKSAATFRELVAALIDSRWQWPRELPFKPAR
ncbi:MAG: hypothetical protein ABIQ12_04045 [Opitutaceae bacterium]